MSTPLSIDARFVALHQEFLRRLARGLVGQDPAAVDDAVQDVWVRALKAPPRESPRAYLAATLRNGVARLRSRERARGSVERVAARSEQVGGDPRASAAGLLDGDIDRRLALHDELTRALRGLPDEQRRALYLRYSEDLTPAEIAARTGEPLGTVKTRLARGLAALRADLDARHGGERARWAAALPLGEPLGWTRSGAARSTLPRRTLELTVATVTTLIGVALYVAWPAAPRPTQMARPSPSTTNLVTAPEVAVASAELGAAQRVALQPPGVESSAFTQDPPLDPGTAPVRWTILDEAGAPIVGAVVRATARKADERLLANWGPLPTSLERLANATAQGVATLELPAHPALRWKLVVEAAGYGGLVETAPLLVPRVPLDFGILTLRPEAILEVEILGPSGEPLIDSGELWVRGEFPAFTRTLDVWHRQVTTQGGRAVIRGLPAGQTYIQSASDSFASSEVKLSAGETRAVTLTLDEAPDTERVKLHLMKVFGEVPSPTEVCLVLADGTVRAPEEPRGVIQSGSAIYVWRGVPEGSHSLRVVSPGFEPYTAPAPHGSSHFVQIVPSSGVRIAFVDGAGTQVDSQAVVEWHSSTDWRVVTERASPRPSVPLPVGDHLLRIGGERFDPAEVAIEALGPDEWRDVTVTVVPSRVVTGTVVDALGELAAGALVQVLAPAESDDGPHSAVRLSAPWGFNAPGAPWGADTREELAHAFSDAAGRFRLFVARSGPLVVRAQHAPTPAVAWEHEPSVLARRGAPSDSGGATERALGVATEHRGVEVTLAASALVAGRLVGAGGAPFDDLMVVLLRESLVGTGPQHLEEAARLGGVDVAESGEFVLRHLVPGRYVLFAGPSIKVDTGFLVLGPSSFVELGRFEVSASGLHGLELPIDGLVAPTVEVRLGTSLPREPGEAGDPAKSLLLASRALEPQRRDGPFAHLTVPGPDDWGAEEAPGTAALARLRLGPEPRWRVWINDRARGWSIHRDVDLTVHTGPIELTVELADAALSFVDANGAPLAGQAISIAPPEDAALRAPVTFGDTGEVTDSNGRVELRLPCGEVAFTIQRQTWPIRVGPVLWPPPAGTVLVAPD